LSRLATAQRRWIIVAIVVGLVALVFSYSSESDKLQQYKDRVGPAYENMIDSQLSYEENLTRTNDISVGKLIDDPEYVTAMASVAASAESYNRVANRLISSLEYDEPPEKCLEYNSVLIDLVNVLIEGMDVSLEGIDQIITSGSDDTREWEQKMQPLTVSKDQLISELQPAERECFF
jgi:hypothetical protein